MNVRNEQRETEETAKPNSELRQRLVLLAKYWIYAAINVSNKREDDMFRLSSDESAEPLVDCLCFSGICKSTWTS